MKFSLRTRLSLSFAFVAVLLVASISFITNVFLEKHFREYVMSQQEIKNSNVVSSILKEYNSSTKRFSLLAVENIGVNALAEGVIVKVFTKDDKVFWDATVHNNGLCNQMMAQMGKDMASRFPSVKGGYTEKKYYLTKNNSIVGSVSIGYYGPFYYNNNDAVFLKTFNGILLNIGLILLIIAVIIGAVMAKYLANPIGKVIIAADAISKGNFHDRIHKGSSTKELDKLIGAINHLAAELENQEGIRKRLTTDVAHELRTPLATLQSHIEAILDGVWEADKERLSSCLAEVIRINRLVGDLQKLAKFDNGVVALHKEQFELLDLIKNIFKNFENDFAEKNIKASINGEAIQIFADKDKISQVLINLLSNAVKYTPVGGNVTVDMKANTDNVILKVSDDGEGISEEDLPYVFDRLYRADKSRNRQTGGSGIGLAIVKEIVEAHDGEIRVTSKVGVGTTFVVEMPEVELERK